MLKGKVAIITGGTKGIGYAVAKAMLQEGMKVAITGRSQETADESAIALGHSDQVIGIEADVRNYGSQQSVVASVLEKWGRLDAMIANAGVGHFVNIEEMIPVPAIDWLDASCKNRSNERIPYLGPERDECTVLAKCGKPGVLEGIISYQTPEGVREHNMRFFGCYCARK